MSSRVECRVCEVKIAKKNLHKLCHSRPKINELIYDHLDMKKIAKKCVKKLFGLFLYHLKTHSTLSSQLEKRRSEWIVRRENENIYEKCEMKWKLEFIAFSSSRFIFARPEMKKNISEKSNEGFFLYFLYTPTHQKEEKKFIRVHREGSLLHLLSDFYCFR